MASSFTFLRILLRGNFSNKSVGIAARPRGCVLTLCYLWTAGETFGDLFKIPCVLKTFSVLKLRSCQLLHVTPWRIFSVNKWYSYFRVGIFSLPCSWLFVNTILDLLRTRLALFSFYEKLFSSLFPFCFAVRKVCYNLSQKHSNFNKTINHNPSLWY